MGFVREISYYSMKQEKDLQLLTTKSTKKYLILLMLRNIIILFEENKTQNW